MRDVVKATWLTVSMVFIDCLAYFGLRSAEKWKALFDGHPNGLARNWFKALRIDFYWPSGFDRQITTANKHDWAFVIRFAGWETAELWDHIGMKVGLGDNSSDRSVNGCCSLPCLARSLARACSLLVSLDHWSLLLHDFVTMTAKWIACAYVLDNNHALKF